MTRPAGPPIFLSALPIFCAAFAMTGPAVEVTLDKPSEAFDAVDDAASRVLFAACDEEELWRIAVLRVRNRDCRSTARDTVVGVIVPSILRVGGQGRHLDGKDGEQSGRGPCCKGRGDSIGGPRASAPSDHPGRSRLRKSGQHRRN